MGEAQKITKKGSGGILLPGTSGTPPIAARQ